MKYILTIGLLFLMKLSFGQAQSITKLDETRSFGNLISFAHKTKKSITYFSIGQNVPDDLIVSDSTFLIDCFMNRQCVRR